MKKTVKKQLAAGILAGIMALSFTACGSKQEPQPEPPASQSEASDQTSAPEEQTLSDQVSMSEVSISAIDIYSRSLSDYEPEKGYVIQGTVTNNSDVSCDVYPAFSVSLTDEDEYGKARTRTMLLMDSDAVFTPYGPQKGSPDNKFLRPVGLAPKETKEVRYYISTNASSLLAAELQGDEKSGSIGGMEQYYDVNPYTLADVKLLQLHAEEAEKVYLPVAEWGKNVTLKAVDLSMPGLSVFANIPEGTVTNTTKDRWERVNLYFDLSVNGQTMNVPAIRKAERTFDHVDLGDSFDIRDNTGEYVGTESIASAQTKDFQVAITPGLLAYTPDLSAQ